MAQNTTDKYIAPMQSFLVEIAEDVDMPSGLTLTFNPETMSTTSTTSLLRASQNTTANNLTITASNVNGNTTTWLRQSPEANDNFCNEDFSKIIESANSSPSVYTLTTTREGKTRALLLNSIQSNKTVVPIGITSTYSGSYTLTFSGMDSYDAKIFLIDTQKGTEMDITEQTEFSYTFTHNGSTKSSLEDRFILRFEQFSPTGIDEFQSENNIVVYVQGSDLFILSNESDLTKIQVYDLHGKLLIQEVPTNSSLCRLEDVLPNSGVYLIKIHTKQGVVSKKIIR